jgi:hypothetical protein
MSLGLGDRSDSLPVRRLEPVRQGSVRLSEELVPREFVEARPFGLERGAAGGVDGLELVDLVVTGKGRPAGEHLEHDAAGVAAQRKKRGSEEKKGRKEGSQNRSA